MVFLFKSMKKCDIVRKRDFLLASMYAKECEKDEEKS